MKYIAAIIIVGFLGMVFLGLLPMGHSHHHGMSDDPNPCPIASLLNTACTSNGISMAVTHISAIRSFSNTPVSSFFLFLALLVELGFVVCITVKRVRGHTVRTIRVESLLKKKQAHPSSLKRQSWLSLFEHSPTFA
jgi:hypothetical protein